MGDTSERSARAASRPFWFDPRFAIGLVLVVGSVVGVSVVVATVDDTVQVYAARTMLPAGTAVTAADLDVTAVRLGTASAHYLEVDKLPGDGLVLTRAVAAGELLPVSALDERASLGQTSIVVTVGGDVAEAVSAGASVDLWAAPQLEHGRFGAPTIVVPAAEVVRVIDAGGFIGGDSGRSVELSLPTTRIAAVLQAIANADALSLVPADPAIDSARNPGGAEPTDAPATPPPATPQSAPPAASEQLPAMTVERAQPEASSAKRGM